MTGLEKRTETKYIDIPPISRADVLRIQDEMRPIFETVAQEVSASMEWHRRNAEAYAEKKMRGESIYCKIKTGVKTVKTGLDNIYKRIF